MQPRRSQGRLGLITDLFRSPLWCPDRPGETREGVNRSPAGGRAQHIVGTTTPDADSAQTTGALLRVVLPRAIWFQMALAQREKSFSPGELFNHGWDTHSTV